VTRKAYFWPVLVIGVILVVAPFAISLPGKASAGQAMLDSFHPIMQPASVKATGSYFATFQALRPVATGGIAAAGEIPQLVSGLASALHMSQTQVEQFLGTKYPAFGQLLSAFPKLVPVFTNVIFDTSQGHANVVFQHMFAWLDRVLEIIRVHPETFFVIRAHPDECRPGKQSRESVADWVKNNQVTALPNVLFVDASEYFSSYELIRKSKFVMVYNSTIGLEASVIGLPVLCGGKARFTQIPTVFFPPSPDDYSRQAEEFLRAKQIKVPA